MRDCRKAVFILSFICTLLVSTQTPTSAAPAANSVDLALKNLGHPDFKIRSDAASTLAQLKAAEDIRRAITSFRSTFSSEQGHDPRTVYNILVVLKSLATREFVESWKLIFELRGMGDCQSIRKPSFFDKEPCPEKPKEDEDYCFQALGGYRPMPGSSGPSESDLRTLWLKVEKLTRPHARWSEPMIAARGGQLSSEIPGYRLWTYFKERSGSILRGCGSYDWFTWLYSKDGKRLLASKDTNVPARFQISSSGEEFAVGEYFVDADSAADITYDEAQPQYTFAVTELPSLKRRCLFYVDPPGEREGRKVEIAKNAGTASGPTDPLSYREVFESAVRIEKNKCVPRPGFSLPVVIDNR